MIMEREGKILFIAATHGDEGFSLDVLRKLKERYPRDVFGYDRAIGNPRALRRNVRYVEADLNASAPGSSTSPIYEERRAAQIMELSKRYQFLIDIHGTVSDCGIVTIISSPTLANLLLAAALPIDRNVIWYMGRTPGKGPLARFADCPGIAIECGPKSSETVKRELEGVLGTLLETKVDCNLDTLLTNLKKKDFYSVYAPQSTDGRDYTDFELTRFGDEEFYPFLANQYPGIACYKMKKVNFQNLFLP